MTLIEPKPSDATPKRSAGWQREVWKESHGTWILAFAASGMEFAMSVTTSAASVSNMGPLLDTTMPDFGYAEFSNAQLFISIGLMLIGRIEVLAAFAILSPSLWKR